MSFSVTHPTWMWLFFGGGGTLATVLFTIAIWHWMQVHARLTSTQRLKYIQSYAISGLPW